MEKILDKLYDGSERKDWEGLKDMDKDNTRHILSLFSLIGIPKSYLDVGCGTGIMVKIAKKLGVRAFGVDQLVTDKWGDHFVCQNLVDEYVAPQQVQLVTSLEVAEHLHESAHATYCDTLCNNVIPELGGDNFLVFSAARPGQGGQGHVACRPAEYWHEQFRARGLSYNGSLSMNLALLWSNIKSPLSYLWDNLMVFEV